MPPKTQPYPRKQTARKRTSGRRAKVLTNRPVENVPTELLVSIFKHLYGGSMTPLENTPRRVASPGSVFKPIENSGAVSISYPLHAPAGVCQRWRDILRSMPEYHSHVIIYLDEEPALEEIAAQIKSARDIPLDVLVTSHDDDDENSITPADEMTRARALMTVLSPIIIRCRSFIFNVVYSSSLPCISRDFHGDANRLRVLKLQCSVDLETPTPDPTPASSKLHVFTCPQLTTIVLDSYTWMDAHKDRSWAAQLRHKHLDSLTISNFTFVDECIGQCEMQDFAQSLSKLGFIRHLTLDSVDVPVEPGHFDEGTYETNINNLTVIDVESDFMEEFFFATYGNQLCFYHAIGTNITWVSLPQVHHLRLEKTPDVGYDFMHALKRFFGHRLDIYECNDFGDSHLDHIAHFCEPLRRLYIKDCPDITINGLKNMLLKRIELVSDDSGDDSDTDDVLDRDENDSDDVLDRDENDSDDQSIVQCDADAVRRVDSGFDSFEQRPPRAIGGYRLIHHLHITGHPAKLSNKDRKWFRDRLDSFYWE